MISDIPLIFEEHTVPIHNHKSQYREILMPDGLIIRYGYHTEQDYDNIHYYSFGVYAGEHPILRNSLVSHGELSNKILRETALGWCGKTLKRHAMQMIRLNKKLSVKKSKNNS